MTGRPESGAGHDRGVVDHDHGVVDHDHGIEAGVLGSGLAPNIITTIEELGWPDLNDYGAADGRGPCVILRWPLRKTHPWGFKPATAS
jgi:hypothetical protein